jgi:hypothetical protein
MPIDRKKTHLSNTTITNRPTIVLRMIQSIMYSGKKGKSLEIFNDDKAEQIEFVFCSVYIRRISCILLNDHYRRYQMTQNWSYVLMDEGWPSRRNVQLFFFATLCTFGQIFYGTLSQCSSRKKGKNTISESHYVNNVYCIMIHEFLFYIICQCCRGIMLLCYIMYIAYTVTFIKNAT